MIFLYEKIVAQHAFLPVPTMFRHMAQFSGSKSTPCSFPVAPLQEMPNDGGSEEDQVGNTKAVVEDAGIAKDHHYGCQEETWAGDCAVVFTAANVVLHAIDTVQTKVGDGEVIAPE